ncbi:MAG: hypothetical protein ABEK36_00365 [Candidatus Aenigmatarchaeota archaeon]
MALKEWVQSLENFGFFAYILPWLLTLAIVYGILEHYDMPKSKSARGVISIVAAFMVLPAGSLIQPFLIGIVKNLIVVAVGILVAIIFVELLGYKAGGNENIFEKHPREFGIVLIIIAILVFVGAGGLEMLGFEFQASENLITLLFFLAFLAIGVWWITAEED